MNHWLKEGVRMSDDNVDVHCQESQFVGWPFLIVVGQAVLDRHHTMLVYGCETWVLNKQQESVIQET